MPSRAWINRVEEKNLKGKTCLVTGANSGIGKATAIGLAKKGANIVMVCRNQTRGEAALEEIRVSSGNENISLMLADLASFSSLRSFAEDFSARYDSLDVLVNNAGLYVPTRQASEDGHELTFAVNHLGTFLITMLLMPQLQAAESSRVVVVASTAHQAGRNTVGSVERGFYQGFFAYADAKLANIMFTYELARRCEGTNVTANCLHPGVVRTGFGQDDPGVFNIMVKLTKAFFSSPERGARASLYLASSPAAEGVTGKYFVGEKACRSSRASRSQEACTNLWRLSSELTGADFP